ncbi:MAG: hypothetical protein IT373_30265 [Polyangiaceae bacterium]|nr:hypothetical protein [Polyangiaceae bacterium]
MLGLVLLLQVGTPAPPAPPPAPPAEPPGAVTAPTPPGPPGWGPPYGPPPGYGPGYPPPGYGPGYPPAEGPPAQPVPDEDAGVVHWFMRLGLGGGPAGFSRQTTLLALEGYGGGKVWATLDGAYMPHERIGIGAFMGLNSRSSEPNTSGYYGRAPTLQDVAYFFGAQAPVLIVGSRDVALHVTPRIGFVSGRLAFEEDSSEYPVAYGSTALAPVVETPFQNGVLWGAELSLTSFTYHVGVALGLLRGVVGPTGDLGENHDHGGLYIMAEGSIDG